MHDLPPYFIADGTPAEVRANNQVGLERNGFTPEQLERVRQIYRILYRDGLNRTQAYGEIARPRAGVSAEFQRVLSFRGEKRARAGAWQLTHGRYGARTLSNRALSSDVDFAPAYFGDEPAALPSVMSCYRVTWRSPVLSAERRRGSDAIDYFFL